MATTLPPVKLEMWNQRSWEYQDVGATMIQNEMAPPVQAPYERGEFRVGDARANFLHVNAANVSKYDVGERYGKTGTITTYENKPISAGFMFSNADLANVELHGYMSVGAMLSDYQGWMTGLLRKFKEYYLYNSVVLDNNNYAGAAYYNNAATPWSTIATANPKSDIDAGKDLVPEINAMSISWQGMQWALRNQTFLSQVQITATDRNAAQLEPEVAAFANWVNLDYIFISKGKLITNSADPTDTTKVDIWGDSAVLFHYNPSPSPLTPVWLTQNYWAPLGNGANTGGWFWAHDEMSDKISGGVGSQTWDLWNYYQFLVQRKDLAYRIDNLY